MSLIELGPGRTHGRASDQAERRYLGRGTLTLFSASQQGRQMGRIRRKQVSSAEKLEAKWAKPLLVLLSSIVQAEIIITLQEFIVL